LEWVLLLKIIKLNVQTHFERASRHPNSLLQEVVRLLGMPQRSQRPLAQEDQRDDFCLQKVQ
jgi:hypothetical protein